MGECCGCPVSPNGLDEISVGKDLLANWFIAGGAPASGTVIEVTTPATACNPKSITAPGGNIFGYITHNQTIDKPPLTSSLTEVPLYDQGAPDSAEAAYLASTCAFLAGDGSGAGICCCGESDINTTEYGSTKAFQSCAK